MAFNAGQLKGLGVGAPVVPGSPMSPAPNAALSLDDGTGQEQGAGQGKAAQMNFTEADADSEEFANGVQHEMEEHGIDEQLATQFTLDHLAQHPQYYTALEALEQALDEEAAGGGTDDEEQPPAAPPKAPPKAPPFGAKPKASPFGGKGGGKPFGGKPKAPPFGGFGK